MSGSTSKKIRKEIRKTIAEHKEIVMEHIVLELKKSDFKTRFAFCVLILFSKRKG
jgi:hypothetical protein